MVIDSAGSSVAPEEQPVQRQLSDSAGDGGQRRFDRDDDRTADDVVNMAWCDGRLPATAANLAAMIVGVAFAWSVLYLIVSPELMAVPGGSVSSIFILYVTGAVAGWLINRIVGIPSQYGMLLAGITLRKADLYTVTGWCSQLVSIIRYISFVLMFIKGGLELDAIQLRRLSGVVAKLTLLPCIAEAATSAIAAHLILPGFSWQWSLTLGFTLSAVSPAILVSGLFQLKRLGYGEVKGVNTLLIAASSLDNIVSICAFRIVIGNMFMRSSVANVIIQGFIDVSIGTLMGVIWGFFLIFVPPSPWAMIYKKPKTENTIALQRLNWLITAKRSFLLGTGGFLLMMGSERYGYSAAGPLACIISAFVASTGWRWRLKMQNDRNNPKISVDENCDDEDDQELQGKPVEKVFEYVWDGLQPSVYAFLGTAIESDLLLKEFDMVLVGILVVTIGIAVRMIFTTCSVLGTGFSRKEVIFVNISWLPKSTMQAILAWVAFEKVVHTEKLKFDHSKRSFLLGTGGFLAMTGSRWYGYPVAGPLACIISAFVASTGWRWRLKLQDDRNNPTISVDDNCDDEDDQDLQEKPVEKVFEYVWNGLQPTVFAFLGTDIKFELLKGFDMVLVGLLVVTFGIAVRMIFTTCSVLGTGFSRKEIIFVNISWLLKSTMQAILAWVAFEKVVHTGTDEEYYCGYRLLIIALTSILLTAPIGSIGIKLFGPRLLPRAN